VSFPASLSTEERVLLCEISYDVCADCKKKKSDHINSVFSCKFVYRHEGLALCNWYHNETNSNVIHSTVYSVCYGFLLLQILLQKN